MQHFNDFTKSSESQRLTCVTVQAGGPGEVAPLAELLLTCSATDSPKEIFMPAGLRCVNPVHRAYGATDPFREIFHTVGTVSALWQDNAYIWVPGIGFCRHGRRFIAGQCPHLDAGNLGL